MSGNTKIFSIFVPVPKECMAQVFAKRRTHINQIKEETKTTINYCYEGDYLGKGSGFIVAGDKVNCEAEREAIQHRVENATITINEQIPQQYVGLLIGRRSDNFRRIEAKYDVKISWPKFSGIEKHVIFSIKGSRANCDRAREMLTTNIEKWKKYKVGQQTAGEVASGSGNDSKMDERKIIIPKKFIELICGRNTIATLKTKSGATIWFPVSQPEGEMAIVMVVGSSENCDKAMMLIQDEIEKGKKYKVSQQTAEEVVSGSGNDLKMDERKIIIPKKFIELMCGRNTIATLKTKSGATIWFPVSQPEGEMAIVMVVGSSENCDKAMMLVKDKIENATITINEQIPQQYVGLLTRRGSDNFRRIEAECDVKISWPRFSGTEKHVIFSIKGSRANCDRARGMLTTIMENATITINEQIPQQFVGLLTRKGSDNFRRIEAECDVKISWPRFSGTEKHVIFSIKGSRANCDRAGGMLTTNMEKWKKYKVGQQTAGQVPSVSGNDLKMHERKVMKIPKEFIGLISGREGLTISTLRTKSGAKIWFPVDQPEGKMAIVMVVGSSENCDKAIMLIKDKISGAIEHERRKDLGGDVKFACFSCTDVKNEFQLVKRGNDCSDRSKYRVVSDNYQREDDLFSPQTVASVKKHLSKSLQTLHELKDDKELTVDLWCHFCKIVLENVQEDEANETVSGEFINRRIGNDSHVEDKEAYWRTSFGEFVNPSEVNIGTISEANDSQDKFLKHAQTSWRYDYGFLTPTGFEIRLKVWQDLPEERNEPPDEVKNISQQVFFKGEEGSEVKAWLCYPSVTVLRGDILTPSSKYDCRMKLRAGPRCAGKNDIKQEELDIMADYLSNCTIDKSNHKLVLPDEKCYKIPDDFLCKFYREANEKRFFVDLDKERYCVIVFEEEGWDSMLSQKIDQKEFGIRVTMDSWWKALLSPERNWEPEEILSKVDNYMEFLSVLYSHLFD